MSKPAKDETQRVSSAMEMDADSGAAVHTQQQQAAELVYVSDSDDSSSTTSSTSSDGSPDVNVDDTTGDKVKDNRDVAVAASADSSSMAVALHSLPTVKTLVSSRLQRPQPSIATEAPVVHKALEPNRLMPASVSHSRPIEVLSSPEPVTATKEERVAEAIKILKTVNSLLLKYRTFSNVIVCSLCRQC